MASVWPAATPFNLRTLPRHGLPLREGAKQRVAGEMSWTGSRDRERDGGWREAITCEEGGFTETHAHETHMSGLNSIRQRLHICTYGSRIYTYP
jgi:hypothetical protein